MKTLFKKAIISAVLMGALVVPAFATRYLENLDRGVVAVHTGGSNVFVSWRLLGTEPRNLGFNLYRDGTKLNSSPITGATNYEDKGGSITASYVVKTVVNGQEVEESKPVKPFDTGLTKRIPLDRPAGGTTPDGVDYTYSPNDGSVGDLDGDGQWDIVLKWDPSNSKDNAHSGHTGNVYLDGIKLDGTQLFRIDLGRNIRAGAHYTQFVVADFDLDGKAEIIVKTAPGTKDGLGNYLSTGPAANADHSKDYRNSGGYVLDGPEYLTVFRGTDGKELATVNYNPGRGRVSDWGDNYGNRVDRFLATAAWLDGKKPSAVMQRGYYTRMAIAAWDWDGTKLTQKWFYDANQAGKECFGQGNHQLSVADVYGNGRDVIIQGSCAIDSDGKFMYRTGLGHGDALHVTDIDPSRPGLEVWQVLEDKGAAYGYEMHDAKTGEILWGAFTGTDNGRGMAADVDPSTPGLEVWSSAESTIFSATGKALGSKPSVNFRIYWDGDLQDELLDATGSPPSSMKIEKYNNGRIDRILTTDHRYGQFSGVANNWTKANPVLVADILGDWREEMILTASTNDALILYTTKEPTQHRLYTLMHDPHYRASISWQNTAYNQPPHLGFYLGAGVENAPTPDIALVGAGGGLPVIEPSDCAGVPGGTAEMDQCGRCVGGSTGLSACASVVQGEDFCEGDGVFEDINGGFLGTGYFNLHNETGTKVRYSVNVSIATKTPMYLRAANGGNGPRRMSVSVNGNSVGDFNTPVGSWTQWEVEEMEVELQEGGNFIVLTSLDADGGPNIDLLGFAAAGINKGNCEEGSVSLVPLKNDKNSLQFTGGELRFNGKWSGEQLAVKIFDIKGNELKVFEKSAQTSSLKLNLSQGIYLVEFKNNDGVKHQSKIAVNN
ncbi:MAG: T9SS type A sorting domain-containing protein [Fibrobacter sp.]|nr:T9SS type A sorting domain-containing protein [Fibrobacter sp.]